MVIRVRISVSGFWCVLVLDVWICLLLLMWLFVGLMWLILCMLLILMFWVFVRIMFIVLGVLVVWGVWVLVLFLWWLIRLLMWVVLFRSCCCTRSLCVWVLWFCGMVVVIMVVFVGVVSGSGRGVFVGVYVYCEVVLLLGLFGGQFGLFEPAQQTGRPARLVHDEAALWAQDGRRAPEDVRVRAVWAERADD